MLQSVAHSARFMRRRGPHCLKKVKKQHNKKIILRSCVLVINRFFYSQLMMCHHNHASSFILPPNLNLFRLRPTQEMKKQWQIIIWLSLYFIKLMQSLFIFTEFYISSHIFLCLVWHIIITIISMKWFHIKYTIKITKLCLPNC